VRCKGTKGREQRKHRKKTLPLSVNFASMPDDCYIDYAFVVVDLLNDTVITNPNPKQICCAAELLASGGPRVYGE
jgi:hypothetical protein